MIYPIFSLTPIASIDFQDLATGFNYTDLLSNELTCLGDSDCSASVGSATGTGGVSIDSYGTNKFLTVYSLGGNAGNHKTGFIAWNYSLQDTFSMNSSFLSVTYDMKVNDYPSIPSDTTPFNMYFLTDDLLTSGFQCANPPSSTFCGMTYNNDEDNDNIDLDYGLTSAFSSSGFLPLDSSSISEFDFGECYLIPDIWYNMALVYEINNVPSDNKVTNISIYADGNKCFTWNIDSVRQISRNDNYLIRGLSFYSEVSSVSYDNIKVYENFDDSIVYGEQIEPEIACDFANCIFFDDYSIDRVTNYYSYEDFPDFYLYENNFYFENSGNKEVITYEFDDYTSDEMYIQIIFDINRTGNKINPTDSINYVISPLCGNIETQSFIFSFYNLSEYHNENETMLISTYYNPFENDLQTFSQNIYQFEENPQIIIKYDNGVNKVYMRTEEYSSFFDVVTNVNWNYETAQNNNCSIDRVRIERTDSNSQEGYIGIEALLTYDVTIEDITEEYYDSDFNTTSKNESIIKDDLEDLLQKASSSLGFRSTGMKIVFWIIIIIVFIIFAIESLNAQGSAKNIIIGFLGLSLFITGWYLGFIPTALFIFLIFISAVVSAFVVQQKFTG